MDDHLGGVVTETFDPPLVYAPATTSLGQTTTSAGQVSAVVAGERTAVLNFSASFTPAAFEMISVPVGTFDALKLTGNLHISGFLAGSPEDVRESRTVWMVNGVGIVKLADATNGNSRVQALALTNVMPAAQPSLQTDRAALMFPATAVGSMAMTQQVTFTNTTSGTVTIGAVALQGINAADFSMSTDQCSGKTIASAATCIVSASFSPMAMGSRTASMMVPFNAMGGPTSASMSGSGTAAMSGSPNGGGMGSGMGGGGSGGGCTMGSMEQPDISVLILGLLALGGLLKRRKRPH